MTKGVIASALEAGRRYGTALGARAAGNAERIAGRVAAHPRVAPILARPRVAAGLRQVRAAGWKGALDPSQTVGRAAGAAIGGHRGAKIGSQVGSVASYVPQAVSLGGAAAAGLGIGRETASSDPNKPRKLRKAAPRGRSIYTAPLKQTLREHLRIIAGGTPSPHHLSAIAQGRRAHMDAAQAHIPAALAAIAGAARITGALHA
jgi:hypothetical protein